MGDKEKCLDADMDVDMDVDMDDFLTKPISEIKIREALSKWYSNNKDQ